MNTFGKLHFIAAAAATLMVAGTFVFAAPHAGEVLAAGAIFAALGSMGMIELKKRSY